MGNSINLKKVFKVLIQVLVKFRIEVGFQCIISAELNYSSEVPAKTSVSRAFCTSRAVIA